MFDRKLTQTSIREELWQLHDSDIKAFEREVKEYLSLRYPNYELDSYDRDKQQVFMK